MGWLVLNGALPRGETRDSYLRKSIEDLTAEARAKGYRHEVLASSFDGEHLVCGCACHHARR